MNFKGRQFMFYYGQCETWAIQLPSSEMGRREDRNSFCNNEVPPYEINVVRAYIPPGIEKAWVWTGPIISG